MQGLRRPISDERFVLARRTRSRVLVREVILHCGRHAGRVRAFRGCAPRPRRTRGAACARLGNRPLGAALFADPRIERYPLRHAQDRPPSRAAPARCAQLFGKPSAALWARRSLFRLHDSPILVTEVFLPEILALDDAALERLDVYEQLMRLDKPIGILLLLWPTLWGLWLAAYGCPISTSC